MFLASGIKLTYKGREMSQNQQNPVSATAWKWQENTGEEASHQGHLRQAAVQAVVMCAIAAAMFFWLHHRIVPMVVLALAVVVVVSSVLAPGVFLAIERFGKTLGKVVGGGLTWVLLVPFFYLGFTIGRLLLLVTSRNPMYRVHDDKAETYWIPHPPPSEAAKYRKQF